MPRKLYPSEPAVFFNQLLTEVHAAQPETEPKFSVKTADPVYKSFTSELFDEHFPVQSQLPLD
jgi:hypothetical protein